LPVSGQFPLEKVTIFAKDLNQNMKFPQNLCLSFGKHEELRWKNSIQWFFATGVSLFSSYFLLIISFFLAFSFWFRKSRLGLSLLAYSLVSCVYLISFSEYPRAIFDPVLASGAVHFPLRLLQDLCLIFVFYNFYQKYDSHKIIEKIAWIYAVAIVLYLLMFAIGIRDYVYYSRLVLIVAPLVAAPMAIGTWFAFQVKDPSERKVLIPVSVLLFCFQVNDLLVFWKLIDSYFTVRIYIPCIVGLTLFLYLRRMHTDAMKVNIASERQRILKEFLHDVKSPLAVLKIFFANLNETEGRKQVIQSALRSIEEMISQVDNPNKESRTKIKLTDVLSEIVAQKRLEHPDFEIKFEPTEEVFVFADKSKLQRIFSNIINNAYEAYDKGQKVLELKFILGPDEVHLHFTDKGKGMPRSIYHRLFKENITTKDTGQGIGLMSSHRYLLELGGKLNIISKENHGTTIEIILTTAPGEVMFAEKMTSPDAGTHALTSPDFILIDDDRYIRYLGSIMPKT
jgi:signal transduction histidine kinase